jgi:hypothetical protein
MIAFTSASIISTETAFSDLLHLVGLGAGKLRRVEAHRGGKLVRLQHTEEDVVFVRGGVVDGLQVLYGGRR